jgi:putative transposase
MNLFSMSGLFSKANKPSPKYYFVTLCTRSRANYFGMLLNGHVDLLPAGKIAEFVLARLHGSHQGLTPDGWVIMPNHIHLLLAADCTVTSPGKEIRRIKSAIKRWADVYGQDFHWQLSNQAYPIRDAEELRRLQWYIRKNALVWKSDSMNRENQENQLFLQPELNIGVKSIGKNDKRLNEIQPDCRERGDKTQTDSNGAGPAGEPCPVVFRARRQL